MPETSRRKRWQRTVVIVIAAAMILAFGAGGLVTFLNRSKSAEAPTPSASAPSNTPSLAPPGPKPTKAPKPVAGATKRTEKGAEAAAKTYLDGYAYMFATGDTKRWSSAVSKDCEVCVQYAKQAAELSARGGYQNEGGIGVIEQAATTKGKPITSAHVESRIVQGPGIVVQGKGQKGSAISGATGVVATDMTWTGGKWVITTMTVKDGGQSGAPDPGKASGQPGVPGPEASPNEAPGQAPSGSEATP